MNPNCFQCRSFCDVEHFNNSSIPKIVFDLNTLSMCCHNVKLPLPPLCFEDEPLYVNARQYVRIIKMREKRKTVFKQKRPKYKHESRHQHALRRRRYLNGRFASGKIDEEVFKIIEISNRKDFEGNTEI